MVQAHYRYAKHHHTGRANPASRQAAGGSRQATSSSKQPQATAGSSKEGVREGGKEEERRGEERDNCFIENENPTRAGLGTKRIFFVIPAMDFDSFEKFKKS